MTHPSFEYILVGCTAAIVSFLLTPVARRIAIRMGAVAKPRDRDVHAVATPRMGGIALFAGITLAILVGSHLPTLGSAFNFGPDLPWLIVSGAIICLLGVLDDRFELDSLTKLAGQVVATGVMVILGGVQLEQIYIPGVGTELLGTNDGIPLTILLTLVTVNALNFIDGLDGLAAGVTAISALAFFVFAYHLAQDGYVGAASPPTLIAAALVGACLGFLPHNFSPARIFMGDSGSMLVGLMLSAAATTATEGTDPSAFGSTLGSLPILLPLIIPLAVLALPFVDLLLAVTRRVRRGRSPFSPDKQHLHHRFLEIGHSHRRAVLLLYFWSALIAFGGVGLSYDGSQWLVVWVLSALVVVGLLLTLLPSLRDRVTGPFRRGGVGSGAR
ncbi:glycosyltransferase family 4 protein [Jatrophihabitans endophyticus]|uniref:glycosyltransferase family 4 protein n=1 Tax=Jatrophihabitans endophyticus TaxID=1206085 RepID=UPI0019E2050A|nr:MraY family glycosyltransferase [Jatrophihabitans endophyticus]MBE7188869.1 undecaprenyl/decaprenyl-phosphate alpha-N-acetylglucosaminyl 1-phosphate transferase [Jatrophihabitans endophyticus]